MNSAPLDQLSLERFASLLQTKFRVRLDADRQVDLVLVEATGNRFNDRVGTTASGIRQESFSLLFHGPATPLLPQQMHRIEHDQIGQFDLFVVPVGRDSTSIHYQVIFGRLIKPV